MAETPVLDRNAAFARERAAQIGAIQAWNAGIPARREAAAAAAEKMAADFAARVERGEVRDNKDGTYTALTGWDAGEVWRTQRVPAFNDQEMALPETNLDMSKGRAALYSMENEWHGVGNVVPEGIVDLDEVLVAGGIDFEVTLTPSLYLNPVTGKVEEVPGTFTTTRSDTGAALTKNGQAVGRVYRPIQNRDMGAFLQDLVVKYRIKFLSAGATYGGSHVFIGMQLPEDVLLDLGNGLVEAIEQKLYFIGSHDGTTSNVITVSPWRIGCGNTERFNLRDAVARWATRHTTNALSDANVKEARRTLGLTVKYFTQFKVEEEALARTDLAVAEFEQVMAEVSPRLFAKPDADATDRTKANYDERMGTLTGMFGRQAGETGRTAYSAERAFTDWADHVAPKRALGGSMAAARATAIIEGTDDKVKNRMHERLMARVG